MRSILHKVVLATIFGLSTVVNADAHPKCDKDAISAPVGNQIPDGDYQYSADVTYTIKDGKLVKCSTEAGAYPCKDTHVSYLNEKVMVVLYRSIYRTEDGKPYLNTDLQVACNIALSPLGGAKGPAGTGGHCSEDGWN